MKGTNIFDRDEFSRWMNEAENTLRSAVNDKNSGFYNWCCFKCQQAAEFALKSYLYGVGATPFGHSLTKLVNNLSVQKIDIASILTSCKKLDLFYITSRYANAHSSGAPFEYYDENIANEGLEHAQKVIDFIKGLKNERYPENVL